MRFLLTTDPGLEDLVVGELAGGPASALERPGCLVVEHDDLDALMRLGTIHHVTELRAEGEARTLDDVRRIVDSAPLDDVAGARSFRVSSRCTGDHDFDRQRLQGAAGAVLQRRHGTTVDLEGFELEVRVDVDDERVWVGIQRTRDSLGNRVRRGRSLRSSLKPTIAAAMLRLAGAHEGNGRLADPMCGAGVIPVEAARVNAALELFAADRDPETVETARGTFANHGLALEPSCFDARELGRDYRRTFDFIVTDPPYGVRQGRRIRLDELYRDLLRSFERALCPEGCVVVIVVKHRTFRSALDAVGLNPVHERKVETGGLSPWIFVLR
ncbi:MAG: methyltransferase [bacterium]|nr:methyltransferase [bacterium]